MNHVLNFGFCKLGFNFRFEFYLKKSFCILTTFVVKWLIVDFFTGTQGNVLGSFLN